VVEYSFELLQLIDEEFIGSGRFNSDYELNYESYSSGNLQIVLAGMIRSFDAVTVEKDTIDGITASWYRLPFTDGDEGAVRYYWVFGGYIKEISDPNTKEYEKLFLNSAAAKGLLKKTK